MRAVGLVGALLLIGSWPSVPAIPAAPAPATDEQLTRLIAERARAAATRWGVDPIITVPAIGKLISTQDGRIQAPLEAVRPLLTGASEAQARLIVGWVLAHEVWHQVQYRDGWRRPPNDPANIRRTECVADVMGAFAVLDEDLASRRSQPTDADAQALGATLSRIIDASAQLEAGQTGLNEHPDAAQRRAALRAGFARGLSERIASLSPDTAGKLLRDRLAAVYEMRPGEAADTWADRTCKLMLHDGNGVAMLAAETPTIVWNKDGDPSNVSFRIPYRNTADAPVQATLQVRTVGVPRISPRDRSSWVLLDSRMHTVTIEPGGRYDLTGTLGWVATDALQPKLVFPLDGDSLYDADLIARSPETADARSSAVLDPQPDRLRGQLQTIYNAAQRRFSLISRDCETVDTDRTCILRVTPIGVASTEVVMEANGASRVELEIYRGKSEADALAAYRRFHGWLRAIYPALTFRERSGVDRDSANITPSPLATLSLSRRKTRSGDHMVEATIEPIISD